MLAAAGLIRLGLEARISERLSYDLMLPAPGQAAMAVTARADDAGAIDAVRRALHDERSALCVQVERAMLHELEGGCEVPVAALAVFEDPNGWSMRCRARVASLDGRQVAEADTIRSVRSGDDADAFGRELAVGAAGEGRGSHPRRTRARGGAGTSVSSSRTRVLFTGAAGALAGLAAAVEAEGAQFTEWPLLSFAPPADPTPLEDALRRLDEYRGDVITSPRAAEAVARLRGAARHRPDVGAVVWTSPACEARLRPLFPRIEVPPRDRGAGSLGSRPRGADAAA